MGDLFCGAIKDKQPTSVREHRRVPKSIVGSEEKKSSGMQVGPALRWREKENQCPKTKEDKTRQCQHHFAQQGPIPLPIEPPSHARENRRRGGIGHDLKKSGK